MTTKTKTFRLSGRDMDRQWHVIDVAGRPLGRAASEIAQLLLGKHKPTYEPHLAMGDFVVVVNAAHVALTGNKAAEKVYYRHSGYPGGLRERSFEQQMVRDPRRVVERAVRGMLPHNVRGRELFRHLKVYAGAEHPHEAQVRAGQGARARRRVRAEERAEAETAAEAASPVAVATEDVPAPEAAETPTEADVAGATADGATVDPGSESEPADETSQATATEERDE